MNYIVTIGVNNNNEKINAQTNGYERTEKVQNPYETPQNIFLKKSRSFSKKGNGLRPIPIFSEVLNFSQNTI